ncbi:MAG: 5-fold beta-flower protein [Mucilaginibacter sp.]
MKKLIRLFSLTIIVAACVTFVASAQTQKVAHKISIDKKGGIHDHGGTQLGFIDKDDIVRNNQGQKLYFIDKNGNIIDAYGKNLGKAQKNGNYIDINGATVLTLKDIDKNDCAILDPKGHNMGTVHKNYKLHACAAHCFFLAQKKEKAKQ